MTLSGGIVLFLTGGAGLLILAYGVALLASRGWHKGKDERIKRLLNQFDEDTEDWKGKAKGVNDGKS